MFEVICFCVLIHIILSKVPGVLVGFFLLLLAWLPVGVKVAAQWFPALVVTLVQSLACLQTPLGHSHAEGGLEHECLREHRSYHN